MPAWLLRALLPALFVLPLLVVVVLSAPAWLTWPFLPSGRQKAVVEVLDRLVHWTRAAMPRVSCAEDRGRTYRRRVGSPDARSETR